MERDGTGHDGPGVDTKAAQPNTRFTSPLVINSASRRRSLFSRPKAQEDGRPPSSGSVPDANAESSGNTKIPRPAQRRQFTLSDAYRRAEEEEAAQGSPSPAPRLWRSRRDSTGNKLTKISGPGASGIPQPGRSRAHSSGSNLGEGHDERPGSSQQGDFSDSTFDEKLRQHARQQASAEDLGRRGNAFLSTSRLGTRIVESGKGLLVRRSSRGSFDGFSSPQSNKGASNSPSLLRRFSGKMRDSSDSPVRESTDWAKADGEPREELPGRSTTPPGAPTAAFLGSHTSNRSFAWQADADFTAGDLQVSNSPPVLLGRRNTKIDEIRALEAKVSKYLSESPGDQPHDTQSDSPESRRTQNVPETQAALTIPDKLESHTAARDNPEARSEEENKIPRHRSVSQSSLRLDELRSREIETLSRRALATARLDELRERNIAVSRSPSPDIARQSSRKPIRAFSPLRDRLWRQENETSEARAQAGRGEVEHSIPDPAPSIQGPSPDNIPDTNDRSLVEIQTIRHGISKTEDDAGDVLRRSAAATGSSPTSEGRVVANSNSSAPRAFGLAERARQRRSTGGAKSDARPNVGFVGLSRSSSVDSKISKRRSFANSDSDPTERIEGEMKLFAPQENQSEKGSLRAPSPEAETENEVPAETPKPTKIDPSTLPTPKVTGAFVETPATVKVEKIEDPASAPLVESKGAELQHDGHRRSENSSSEDSKTSLALSGRDGVTARRRKRTQSSRGDRAQGRSSSLSARRRARSLSRNRVPLINSAKPPTVKDDLLEIQRANQIDDSTLEDLADLLDHQEHASPATASTRERRRETGNNNKSDRQKELEVYDRLSRSLETGLLGIRSAKQGIERLEDKVSQAELREHLQHTAYDGHAKGESSSCPVCQASGRAGNGPVTYVHLPLPQFWSRRPKFRFTFLGLSLFLLSLWYITESWMCFRYCKPEYCYPGAACEWSLDDPVWGYAIPVKLDEWATGGQGRRLARRLQPEVVDWVADMWDAVTGTDITTIDTSRYSWEQKRQHRRRLARKGLRKPFVERPEDEAVLTGWRSARQANARAQSAQEMGYEVDEDESIGADEKL